MLPVRSTDLVKRTLLRVEGFLPRSQKFGSPIGPLLTCCKAASLRLYGSIESRCSSCCSIKAGWIVLKLLLAVLVAYLGAFVVLGPAPNGLTRPAAWLVLMKSESS